jgi:ferredoxin
MAEARNRLPENVAGPFYVDSQCIDCDVCRITAPRNFRREETKGYSYVSRQPGRADELARCRDAMACCPVEAIGETGNV